MEEDKVNDKEVVNSVTSLVKAIPIYQDGLQPAVKEVGKALGTVAKTVNIALAPVPSLVWGFEQVKDFIEVKVAEKLKDVPGEKIITPDATIAGPVLESLKYTGHKEELKEMYANLLASSMNSDTAVNAHPSFVEIIKNMNVYEAKIIQYLVTNNRLPMIHIKQVKQKIFSQGGSIYAFKYISKITFDIEFMDEKLLSVYYENLMRLKLIDIPEGRYLHDKSLYLELENEQFVLSKIYEINTLGGHKAEIEPTFIELSAFGMQFVKACVDLTDAINLK